MLIYEILISKSQGMSKIIFIFIKIFSIVRAAGFSLVDSFLKYASLNYLYKYIFKSFFIRNEILRIIFFYFFEPFGNSGRFLKQIISRNEKEMRRF